jgi:hypothetical protein
MSSRFTLQANIHPECNPLVKEWLKQNADRRGNEKNRERRIRGIQRSFSIMSRNSEML